MIHNEKVEKKIIPLMYIEEPEGMTNNTSQSRMIPENTANRRIGEPRLLSNLSVPSFAKLPTQMNRENSTASRLGEPRMLYNLSNSNFEDLDSLNATTQVRKLLEEDETEEGEEWVRHTLFIQMDVLARFPHKRFGWKEIARWLKYEETVDVGDRWSKPHIPTTQMHSLIELRKFFAHEMCIVALDVEVESHDGPYQIADTIKAVLEREERFQGTEIPKLVWETTIAPHKHQHRKWTGKLSTKAFKQYDSEGRPIHYEDDPSEADGLKMKDDVMIKSVLKKKRAVLRKRSGEGTDISMFYTSYPPGATPDNLEPHKPNKHLMKKLPDGIESASVLVGQTDYVDCTFGLFLRMKQSSVMGDLIEVDCPTKFVFLLLGPIEDTSIWEFQEIGRTVGTLFSDRVFVEVAYKAHSREDLINGVEEYIDDVTVLPPSIWEPSTRIEPPVKTVSLEKIHSRLDEKKRTAAVPTTPHQDEGVTHDKSLQRTGRFCGGLINDIKSRYKHYRTDITDGFSIQAIASTIFLFFACITPIVTFGGLMGQKTDGYMGTMETLLAGAICGTIFSLFSGQPLTIVGATGPLLIFESILYRLCKENQLEFMSFRFWIGFWVMTILLIVVAFDLSFLVKYITRFTEESFAILISVIFIYESFSKIYEIYKKYPVPSKANADSVDFNCMCLPYSGAPLKDLANITLPPVINNMTNDSTLLNMTTQQYNWTNSLPKECMLNDSKLAVGGDCASEVMCLEQGWALLGSDCHENFVSKSVSDVFMLSVILFIGTFALALSLKNLRTQRFFPSLVRSTLADFAVFLSVVIFTCVDLAFGVSTPKLNVPSKFVTTRPDRSWFVNPMAVTYWWLIPFSLIPSILATILIFLDQQITAVIVNRKEHKLKKGHGYHLDLFVLSFLIMICSILGIPWFVAATVRSVTHVRSLIMESEVSAPGERHQMIGVREQRVTGFLVHLLIGLSTLITVVLRLIPMPVLYGVFLYMGFTSLSGVQFVQRISILFMPAKYQPDYIFLRHVQTLKVHAFTIVQVVCFVLMWVVKQVKAISIAFPLMLIALIGVRKILDYIFTQSDLYWLDHLLPEEQIRQHEDVSNVKPTSMLRVKPEKSDLTIDVHDVKRRKRTRSSIMEDQNKTLLKGLLK